MCVADGGCARVSPCFVNLPQPIYLTIAAGDGGARAVVDFDFRTIERAHTNQPTATVHSSGILSNGLRYRSIVRWKLAKKFVSSE